MRSSGTRWSAPSSGAPRVADRRSSARQRRARAGAGVAGGGSATDARRWSPRAANAVWTALSRKKTEVAESRRRRDRCMTGLVGRPRGEDRAAGSGGRGRSPSGNTGCAGSRATAPNVPNAAAFTYEEADHRAGHEEQHLGEVRLAERPGRRRGPDRDRVAVGDALALVEAREVGGKSAWGLDQHWRARARRTRDPIPAPIARDRHQGALSRRHPHSDTPRQPVARACTAAAATTRGPPAIPVLLNSRGRPGAGAASPPNERSEQDKRVRAEGARVDRGDHVARLAQRGAARLDDHGRRAGERLVDLAGGELVTDGDDRGLGGPVEQRLAGRRRARSGRRRGPRQASAARASSRARAHRATRRGAHGRRHTSARSRPGAPPAARHSPPRAGPEHEQASRARSKVADGERRDSRGMRRFVTRCRRSSAVGASAPGEQRVEPWIRGEPLGFAGATVQATPAAARPAA